MKLLRYTHLNLSLLLFLLLGGWGTFFYFAVIDEVMDETDDALDNYRDIIVGKILADSTLLEAEDRVIHSYSIRPLTAEEASSYREQYYDGTVYIETEDEYEPVRIMKSCFMATDLNYYELELRLSTLERDDVMTAILKYLVALYLVLLCCISFGTRLILKSVFRPLDRLLAWLENVVPLSLFRSHDFVEGYGLRLADGPLEGLMARAVVVIGEDGKVRYTQLVKVISDEPDYEAALKAL